MAAGSTSSSRSRSFVGSSTFSFVESIVLAAKASTLSSHPQARSSSSRFRSMRSSSPCSRAGVEAEDGEVAGAEEEEDEEEEEDGEDDMAASPAGRVDRTGPRSESDQPSRLPLPCEL